jgi:hypothetical protein
MVRLRDGLPEFILAPRGALSYPSQSEEELRGEFLGPMAYPEPKGNKGTIACQKTNGQAQAYGVMRWETRVIWRKLYCLNPNLQKVQSRRPSERRLKPTPVLRWQRDDVIVSSRMLERCPMRVLKEISGAPKSR